jgi:hypothetical protein
MASRFVFCCLLLATLASASPDVVRDASDTAVSPPCPSGFACVPSPATLKRERRPSQNRDDDLHELAARGSLLYPLSDAGANPTSASTFGTFNWLGPIGWRFVTSATIYVQQIGISIPSPIGSESYQLELYDATTQSDTPLTSLLVTSATPVAHTQDSWSYYTVPTTTLPPGNYVVTLTPQSAQPLYFVFDGGIWNPTGTVTYVDEAWSTCNCGGNSFPGITYNSGTFQYGAVDLGYSLTLQVGTE